MKALVLEPEALALPSWQQGAGRRPLSCIRSLPKWKYGHGMQTQLQHWRPAKPSILLRARPPASACADTEARRGTTLSLVDLVSNASLARKGPPEESLTKGSWAKLICGASFEDVVEIRSLAHVYTLAGVDCIDCAADEAVVRAVQAGVQDAIETSAALAAESGQQLSINLPWLMISINDENDPHFRKAEFDPVFCPVDCPRPCETVCPAAAIALEVPVGTTSSSQPSPAGATEAGTTGLVGGVITERCYGCGRCFSVCPLGLIEGRSYVRPLAAVADLLTVCGVDAVEIHTRAESFHSFEALWRQLGPALQNLRLVAVSVPDKGPDMIAALNNLYCIMQPWLRPHSGHAPLLLWQLDGRPMSGDIGAGATRSAVGLAKRVLAAPDKPPGFVQLAGGTNSHTVSAMRASGILAQRGPPVHSTPLSSLQHAAGVAWGGYARKIIKGPLNDATSKSTTTETSCTAVPQPLMQRLEVNALHEAVVEAYNLLAPLKGYP